MTEHTPLSMATRILHWTVAVFMIGILASGIYMTRAHDYNIYAWHKSFGMLALFVIALRVIWRTAKGWPSKIATHTKIERILARIIHYFLIIGTVIMPVSGIAMTVLSGRSLQFFGIEVLSETLNGAGERTPINVEMAGLANTIHVYSAYIIIGALALHIIGAVKHHIIDKDNTLKRMIGLKEKI